MARRLVALSLIVLLATIAVAETRHVHSARTEKAGQQCALCVHMHLAAVSKTQVSLQIANVAGAVFQTATVHFAGTVDRSALYIRPPPSA